MKLHLTTPVMPLLQRLCAALSTVLILALSGCNIARESSPSHFYLLDALPAETESMDGAAAEAPRVGIGRLQIPAYLDRPQIVSRLDGNRLNYAEFNRWGEPLADGISRALRANIASLTAWPEISAYPWHQDYPRDFNVHVTILAFEPDLSNGETVLRAIYRVVDGRNRETLMVAETEYRVPLATHAADYEAMVRTLSQTLADLSREIAQNLAAAHASGEG